jgi:hypothetical protein
MLQFCFTVASTGRKIRIPCLAVPGHRERRRDGP